MIKYLLAIVGIGVMGVAAWADSRPNILFIMTDDHAAHAISAYGSQVNQTPNLDRLAKAGVRFNRCFAVNSICSPSRATILTGKYSHLNGVPTFNRFDGAQPTAPKYLQKAGYYTGMIGKWHLGSEPTGFNKWSVLPGQGAYHDPAFLEPAGGRVIEGYATTIITDLAIDFLKQRPKDQPFFLMCHHKAPHRPWEPEPRYKEEFANKTIPEPATLRDDYSARTDAIRECRQKVFSDLNRRDLKIKPPADLKGPALQAWLNESPTEVLLVENEKTNRLSGDALDRWKYQRYMQDYLACVQSVDDSVGRLLDCLDQEKLAENTLVIYTSDQGFFLGDHGLYDKRFMYEPSIQMPFLVRWPAAIKPGRVDDHLLINTDFAPTFLSLAGAKIPEDMQGRNLVPLFKSEKVADWRTSFYYRYYHDPGDHNTRAHYGVRTDTHKLIHYWKKNQWEMFDLRSDPNELKNLFDDPRHQEVVSRLKTELFRLKRELKDEDQYAEQQPPHDVSGQPAPAGGKKKRGKG